MQLTCIACIVILPRSCSSVRVTFPGQIYRFFRTQAAREFFAMMYTHVSQEEVSCM